MNLIHTFVRLNNMDTLMPPLKVIDKQNGSFSELKPMKTTIKEYFLSSIETFFSSAKYEKHMPRDELHGVGFGPKFTCKINK